MTAYVTIPVATANAIKVPNGALRYKPDFSSDEIRALYQRYGIPENAAPQPAPAQEKSGGRPQAQTAGAAGGGRSQEKPLPESTGPRYDTQVVWKLLPDKSLEPVRIKTGITDHTFTALVQTLNGDLKQGDDLVTGLAQGRTSEGPLMSGPGATRR